MKIMSRTRILTLTTRTSTPSVYTENQFIFPQNFESLVLTFQYRCWQIFCFFDCEIRRFALSLFLISNNVSINNAVKDKICYIFCRCWLLFLENIFCYSILAKCKTNDCSFVKFFWTKIEWLKFSLMLKGWYSLKPKLHLI